MNSDRLSAALEYAAHGWPVGPLHGLQSGHCSCHRGPECAAPGKHPRTQHGSKDFTTDAEQIRTWWTWWPNSNVGIATGQRSGIMVLDVDGERGLESLRDYEDRYGPLPETPRSRTGSGGLHLLFAWPGIHLGNTASILGPGLDIRCCGGLIVAPPSIHASGRPYQWEVSPW